jgi:hypothetical protein
MMTPEEVKKWEKDFIVERQGKKFVLYAGLLDMAHKKGLGSITTAIVQIPDTENGKTAICTATATFDIDDKVLSFTGIGDAAPNNVAPAMQTCLLRMAETRAKSRALRDGVNIGVASIEELGNGAGDDSNDEAHAPAQEKRDYAAEFKAKKVAFGGGKLSSHALARHILGYAPGREIFLQDYELSLQRSEEKWREAIAAIQQKAELDAMPKAEPTPEEREQTLAAIGV